MTKIRPVRFAGFPAMNRQSAFPAAWRRTIEPAFPAMIRARSNVRRVPGDAADDLLVVVHGSARRSEAKYIPRTAPAPATIDPKRVADNHRRLFVPGSGRWARDR